MVELVYLFYITCFIRNGHLYVWGCYKTTMILSELFPGPSSWKMTAHPRAVLYLQRKNRQNISCPSIMLLAFTKLIINFVKTLSFVPVACTKPLCTFKDLMSDYPMTISAKVPETYLSDCLIENKILSKLYKDIHPHWSSHLL